MLHNRQELDVGKAHFLDVGNELIGQLLIREPAVLRSSAPGAKMHFVDGLRGGDTVLLEP